jgi:hypothetical protein
VADRVEDEPQFSGRPLRPDPSERAAEEALAREPRDPDDEIDHDAFEEPNLGPAAGGVRPYATWLRERRAALRGLESWGAVALAALAAGPLAILGALMGMPEAQASLAGVAAVILAGPAVEEIMKSAVAAYLVERRPYLFLNRVQVLLCAAAGGLVFAALENALYLKVYIPNPSSRLVAWRWTICVLLHVGCSLTVGWGLARAWSRGMTREERPVMESVFPFVVGAYLVHAAYNTFAVLASGLLGLR